MYLKIQQSWQWRPFLKLHFWKMTAARKIHMSYHKIKHAVTTQVYTSNGIKNLYLKKWGMRLKLSSAPLRLTLVCC